MKGLEKEDMLKKSAMSAAIGPLGMLMKGGGKMKYKMKKGGKVRNMFVEQYD